MKAVVLEVRRNEAAIMLMDGTVRRVRGRYITGQEIDYRGNTRASALRWVAAVIIAGLLLTLSAGLWINSNYVACAEVSLDVNPAIAFTLNRRNRVLSVRAINPDAEAIVQALQAENIRFTPIDDAVERTMAVLTGAGYLSDTEACVLASVSADDEKLQQALTEQVEAAMARVRAGNAALEYRIDRTDRATANAARDHGMSTGRYNAWKNAADGTTAESYLEKSIRDILS